MFIADPDRTDEERDLAGDSALGGVGLEAGDDPRAGSGPPCPHCHEFLPERDTTVCPRCGFYPSLGICVDVDARWERLAGNQTSTDAALAAEPKSHLQVWIELIPPWGWQLISYNVIILLASVAARLLLPAGVVRTAWSVTQLVSGITAFCTCHVLAYLLAIAEDASMGLFDIVLKPISIWKQLLRRLPEKLRIAAGASCGVTAAVGSLLIIGSLNYAVLLDWGIKPPPKQNLAGAIAQQSQQDGALDEGPEDEKPKLKMDCVILGYQTNGKNPERITTLVLAREHLGRLLFIGTVRGGLDDAVQQHLEKFREIQRPQPFINIPIILDAEWVQPLYSCRVKYERADEQSGRLIGLEYGTFLGRISF